MAAVILFGSVGSSKMGRTIAKEIIDSKLAPCVYVQKVDCFSHNSIGKENVAIIKTNNKHINQILNIV